MKPAHIALICGLILSYLLPWQVYIVEWESCRPTHGDPVLIPIRCTYPSGFRGVRRPRCHRSQAMVPRGRHR